MQTIQLYIEGQRVDMFKDESVSLTQSIQNVKDISKIFTDFSRTFTLPASKTNNKIFKHYYNFSIQNGFDGRTKKNATIELNHLPFRDGKIKLEGVDLKNNVPYSYKITFFGSTVTLKDLLGEDKLNALNSLNALNETYSPSEIEAGLKRDPSTNDVVVPLITHTKRLFYDSVTHNNNDGNLYYHMGGGSNLHGVAWSELKYALRVHKIVEAIQNNTKYNITFSDDFFVDTNERYYNLFMWLHRKKGDVISGTQIETYSKLVDGWTAANGSVLDMLDSSTAYIQNFVPIEYIDVFELRLERVTSAPYGIQIFRNGVEVYSESDITLTTRAIDLMPYAQANAEYTVVLSYAASITFTNIKWTLDYTDPDPLEPPTSDVYSTGTFSVATVFEFIITEQIPDIKVIDFLTGLFKMFNLTAYIERNTNIIKVLPLNEFYANSSSYDISKYIVSDSSSVNVSLPYRDVSFSYEDTNTFLAKTHNQLFGQEWAKAETKQELNESLEIDGELYDIKLPFSHLKYERLYDVADETLTTIQWGWFVDDNQDSYIGKPLLFYPVLNAIQDNGVAEGISFVDAVDTDGTYSSHKQITGNIVMPSNAVSFVDNVNTANINFKAEKNEYRFGVYTNTLFKEYYQNYITSVFNESNRLTKLTAYLPLSILLNYTLADRFIINGNSYKINSITTNLETGKSELELLNDL
jgi:hypothetical protein